MDFLLAFSCVGGGYAICLIRTIFKQKKWWKEI